MVCERLSMSLYDWLKQEDFRPYPLDYVRSFARQILEVRAPHRFLGGDPLPAPCPVTRNDTVDPTGLSHGCCVGCMMFSIKSFL
jgi:hypothetical protein